MKKLLTMLLAILMLLSLFGCSKPAGSTPDSAPSAENTPSDNADTPADAAPAASKYDEGDTIKIGMVAYLTGPQSNIGDIAMESATLAIDRINAAGGVLGKQLELVVEDAGENQQTNYVATSKILSDGKISCMYHTWASSDSISASPLVLEYKIPTIAAGSSMNVWKEENPYMWQIRMTDNYNAPVMAEVATQQLGMKNPAIIYLTDSFGEGYYNGIKDAFDAMPDGAAKDRIAAEVEEMKPEAEALMLDAENAPYALAYIKLFCEQYNEQTDDGPICNTLVTKSAADQCGLLVYSKLRSVEESAETSVNNIAVAAYQDGYQGIGGYAYKHYLQVLKTSPLPWTSCAFIAYMTTTNEGFAAWGKDMGGYSANPVCMQDHSQDGYVDGVNTYDAKNDRGYEWWVSADGGRLVVEDPAYCAQVSFDLGDWIDMIVGNK